MQNRAMHNKMKSYKATGKKHCCLVGVRKLPKIISMCYAQNCFFRLFSTIFFIRVSCAYCLLLTAHVYIRGCICFSFFFCKLICTNHRFLLFFSIDLYPSNERNEPSSQSMSNGNKFINICALSAYKWHIYKTLGFAACSWLNHYYRLESQSQIKRGVDDFIMWMILFSCWVVSQLEISQAVRIFVFSFLLDKVLVSFHLPCPFLSFYSFCIFHMIDFIKNLLPSMEHSVMTTMTPIK